MRWSDIPWQPADRTLRQFAGLWLLFFSTLSAVQLGHDRLLLACCLAGLALTVGLLGLVWPRGVRPIFVSWMVLAFPLGWLVLNVCLTLIYFGLFTPLALFFRLSGRDALGLRRRPDQASYLQPKPAAPAWRYYRTF